MSKKKHPAILLITLFLIGALLSTACGNSDDPDLVSPTISASLNLFSRSGYFAPSVIKEFEAEFEVKINIDTYPDEDFMLSVIQSSPAKYDLIFPTESQVAQMIPTSSS